PAGDRPETPGGHRRHHPALDLRHRARPGHGRSLRRRRFLMRSPSSLARTLLGLAVLVVFTAVAGSAEPRLRLLFLGDKGHHRPADRFRQIAPVLKKRGIDLVYTEDLADLNAKTLAGYDGLIVYANQTKITPTQESALLDYVASGKGFIP